MAIRINKIIDILNSPEKEKKRLGRIVFDYAVLKQKFEDPDLQTWYFKNSIESNQKTLLKLINQFDRIRSDINDSTIDDLIAAQNEYSNKKSKMLSKGYMNTIDQIGYSNYVAGISYYEELIAVKSRLDKIEPIDYYIENNNDLLLLLGW